MRRCGWVVLVKVGLGLGLEVFGWFGWGIGGGLGAGIGVFVMVSSFIFWIYIYNSGKDNNMLTRHLATIFRIPHLLPKTFSTPIIKTQLSTFSSSKKIK